ncbi:uncharacterized protein [Diadema setosum]|uniref:uncharacterized protein n=1 Tax=Diadema setosum TaxID=31175 RepID=UPI003B3AC08A
MPYSEDKGALFADDCALMAHEGNNLQVIVNKFLEASKIFGLTISLGKTEVLLQPAPNSDHCQPSITINGTQLKNVNSFKYLASTLSSNGTLNNEIAARIQMASLALGRLCMKVLHHKNFRLSMKLKVYNTVSSPLISALRVRNMDPVYRKIYQKAGTGPHALSAVHHA